MKYKIIKIFFVKIKNDNGKISSSIIGCKRHKVVSDIEEYRYFLKKLYNMNSVYFNFMEINKNDKAESK